MSVPAPQMKGTYLENYLESISTLPSEIRRNFALLRELDSRSQECIDRVEEQIESYMKSKKSQREHIDEETGQMLAQDLNTCMVYADEKIELAVQTYEVVDKHIRRLDQDLRKFEAELETAPPEMFQDTDTTTRKKDKKEKRKGKEDKMSMITPDAKRKGRDDIDLPSSSRKGDGAVASALAVDGARVLNVDADMPIDPNEPTYCFCNKVSFGEMVGCDNPDCKVEWFHFECVGLTNPPKGKWYCPECSALKKKIMYK
eukprot:TRINITY_DN10410_c0_g1_i6.p1 TRINITY_DN10410_c0_g1~~TRINITY_DN10410_c0_g1_i6.p1  ORF type:complete len:258 (-),score=44.00 TRINITY_DN10410_c0_g1_i6:5-778(-)